MKEFKDEKLKELVVKMDTISKSLLNGEINTLEQMGEKIEKEFDEEARMFLLTFLLSERFVSSILESRKQQEKQKENRDAMFS